MTDWGQSLALVYKLCRENRRLSQANEQLQADWTESLAALARIADSLEREARRLPVQAIPPSTRAPGGRHGPDGSPP
jgi:hypothetical protein